jgi:NADPH2:quinone reductase
MRGWRVHRVGEPVEVLELGEAPVPEPGPGQVRIRVRVSALNFADDLVCRGRYQVKPELPFTPGMEAAGVVDALAGGAKDGEDAVLGLSIGDRVMANLSLPHGGLAEYALADVRSVYRVPPSVSDEQAAGILVPYLTTHCALHRRAKLAAGETLLVHAGAGGMGSAAIQLGVAAGARVLATAGGRAKVALCRDLGAEIGIDYRDEDFVAIVNEATGGEGANVIYDPVGGDTFDRSRKCIAWEGRILIIGFSGGRIADLPTNHALVKNYSAIGIHMAQYGLRDRPYLESVHQDLMRLLADGKIDPMIHLEVPLEGAADAIAALADRKTTGKVIVRVAP